MNTHTAIRRLPAAWRAFAKANRGHVAGAIRLAREARQAEGDPWSEVTPGLPEPVAPSPKPEPVTFKPEVDDELPPAPGWNQSREWSPIERTEEDRRVPFSLWGSEAASGAFRRAKERINFLGPNTIRRKVTSLPDGLQQAEVLIVNRATKRAHGQGFFTFAPKGAQAPLWRVPHGVSIETLDGQRGTLSWTERWRDSRPVMRGRYGSRGPTLTPDTVVTVKGDPEPWALAMAVVPAVNDYVACVEDTHPERCAQPLPKDGIAWPAPPRARSGIYTPNEFEQVLGQATDLPEVQEIMAEARTWGSYPRRIGSSNFWEYYVRDRISGAIGYLKRPATDAFYAPGNEVLRTVPVLERWRTSPDAFQVEIEGYGTMTIPTLPERIRSVRKMHADYLAAVATKTADELLRLNVARKGLHLPEDAFDVLLEKRIREDVTKGRSRHDYGYEMPSTRRGKAAYIDEPRITLQEIRSPAKYEAWKAQAKRIEAARSAANAAQRTARWQDFRAVRDAFPEGFHTMTRRKVRGRLGKNHDLNVSSRMSGKTWVATLETPRARFIGPEVLHKEDAIPALAVVLDLQTPEGGPDQPTVLARTAHFEKYGDAWSKVVRRVQDATGMSDEDVRFHARRHMNKWVQQKTGSKAAYQDAGLILREVRKDPEGAYNYLIAALQQE